MNGYIIEVTNKLTNKVEYVKNYVNDNIPHTE